MSMMACCHQPRPRSATTAQSVAQIPARAPELNRWSQNRAIILKFLVLLSALGANHQIIYPIVGFSRDKAIILQCVRTQELRRVYRSSVFPRNRAIVLQFEFNALGAI